MKIIPDTSTAHQRAVLTNILNNGVKLPAKYMITPAEVEAAKLYPEKASNGYISMIDGKFYLSTSCKATKNMQWKFKYDN